MQDIKAISEIYLFYFSVEGKKLIILQPAQF
jgi:hypothetical protein